MGWTTAEQSFVPGKGKNFLLYSKLSILAPRAHSSSFSVASSVSFLVVKHLEYDTDCSRFVPILMRVIPLHLIQNIFLFSLKKTVAVRLPNLVPVAAAPLTLVRLERWIYRKPLFFVKYIHYGSGELHEG